MRRRSTNAYKVFIGESILADLTVELLLWVLIRRMMAWSHQCKAAGRRLWWGRQTLKVMGIEHRLEPELTFRFSQNCWYLFIPNFFWLADRKKKRPPSITNEEEGGWTTTFGVVALKRLIWNGLFCILHQVSLSVGAPLLNVPAVSDTQNGWKAFKNKALLTFIFKLVGLIFIYWEKFIVKLMKF